MLGEKNYIFVLSIVVGLIAGLAAVTLKSLAHYLGEYLYGQDISFMLVPLIPSIGIFFCIIFTRLFVKGPYEKAWQVSSPPPAAPERSRYKKPGVIS